MSRILGMDISRYDVQFNPSAAWDAGVRFVIVRDGYGLTEDTLFQQHKEELNATPDMIRGVYHYLSSGVSGEEQARFLWERTQGWADFLAIDFEEYYNEMTPAFAAECLRAIQWLQANTGLLVLLYTGFYQYRDVLRRYSDEFDDVPFWIAQYPYYGWSDAVKNLPASDAEPDLPPTRDTWTVWQFTAYAPAGEYGVSGKEVVDLNMWNETDEAKWRRLFRDTVPPQQSPLEEARDALLEARRWIDEALTHVEEELDGRRTFTKDRRDFLQAGRPGGEHRRHERHVAPDGKPR